ncbi:MFS transporter [Streptomyces liangshanensis]|uniref:MFS transporter n=1 Tax=Streptomyces liangshanensis TaxID=2717324 RepID=UPI0036DD4CC9
MLVWSGQAVSLVGSAAVRFAFIVEVWSSGERATAVTLLSLCAMLPQAVFSPIAGAIVDRMPKRTALQLADAGGLVVVGSLALLHYLGALQSWQIYPATVLLGVCAAFQFPALSSAVPLLVRKDQLGRANGLLAGAKSAAGIGGPALGGLLVALFGIGPTLLVDVASYAFALVGIRLVRLKGDVVVQDPGGAPRRRITADAVEGLRYLFRVPSLRDLIVNFCLVNLVMVFGFALISPMVLLRADTGALAAVNSAIGIGGVAGALLMAAWGGPRNRGRGMMLGVVGMCLSGLVAMGLAGGVAGWCVAILIGALLMTTVNASMQAIVQTKVPHAWQGRVFGAVMFLSQISVPVAMAVSGPLADHVFEPAAADGSGIFTVLGPLVGDGPGSGMAAMLFLAGVGGTAIALWGLAGRSIRDIDVLLLDHDAPGAPDAPEAPEATGASAATGAPGNAEASAPPEARPAPRAESSHPGGERDEVHA